MYFNKAAIAIFAMAISHVFAAPVTEPEAFEKRDIVSSLSSVASTLNKATTSSIATLNADLTSAAAASTTSSSKAANAKIGSSLSSIASEVNTATSGVLAAVAAGSKKLTTTQAVSIQGSVTSIENSANAILAVIKKTQATIKKETFHEFYSIEGTSQGIAGTLDQLAASLQTYLGLVSATSGSGVSGSIKTSESAVSNILNIASGILSAV